jgi:hypothetical protein
VRQEDPEHTRGPADDDGLDEKLLHEHGARGTNREAQRDFLLPLQDPRQQQRGDIRARDHEHACDRGQQRVDGRRDTCDERCDEGARLADIVRVDTSRVPRFIAVAERGELLPCLLERDAAAEPRNGLRERGTGAHLRRRQPARFEHPRREQLYLCERCGEPGRHHTDHLPPCAIELNRLADDRLPSAELRLPQLVTDDTDGWPVRNVLLGCEVSPECRLDLQSGEERSADPQRVELRGRGIS